MELRDYQQRALDAVVGAWGDGYSRVLVSHPTGCGKTVLGADLVRQWPDLCGDFELPDRVLWLAHRDELISQAAKAIKAATGEPVAIEKGEQSAHTGATFGRRVVVSSIQSLLRDERRERFGASEFGLVVLDEAHHAVAESYVTVLNYFSDAKLLGMTATTDRTDEISLGKMFEVVPEDAHYHILDAMQDGWLAPIKQQFVEVKGLDWSSVDMSAAEIPAEHIERVIREESVLHHIVAPIAKMIGDRQTIVFAPSVPMAHAIAVLLNRYGKSAEAIDGTTPEDQRRNIIDRYHYAEFQCICNYNILLEGFDDPATSCVVIARLTKSRLLYAQMLGRPLRGGPRCPVEGKTDALIIDLVGASIRHKLVTSADVLGGKYHEEVVDAARRAIEERTDGEQDADVLEELLLAKQSEQELLARKRASIIAEAKTKRKTIDPFAVFDDAAADQEVLPGWWEQGSQATEEQVERLATAGIKAEGSLTFEDARRLLKEVGRRRDAGLCSYKQARLLRARGFDHRMSMAEAGDVMDHLSKRQGGWSMLKEDFVRRAKAKREGQGVRYSELNWRYKIREGVTCEARLSDDPWHTIDTTRDNVFHAIAERQGEMLVFQRGNALMRVASEDVTKTIQWE